MSINKACIHPRWTRREALQRIDKTCIARVEAFVTSPFERMTYTDAITALDKSSKAFEFPVRWGIDLHIHMVGDRAFRTACDAVAEARVHGPAAGLRRLDALGDGPPGLALAGRQPRERQQVDDPGDARAGVDIDGTRLGQRGGHPEGGCQVAADHLVLHANDDEDEQRQRGNEQPPASRITHAVTSSSGRRAPVGTRTSFSRGFPDEVVRLLR